jgi:hypothetical protein
MPAATKSAAGPSVDDIFPSTIQLQFIADCASPRSTTKLLMWLKDSAKQSLYNSPANEGANTLAVASRSSCTRGCWKLTASDHHTWYVSYRTNITPKRDDGERRSVRATRKFKTEAEAKQFAEEIIKGGWSAIAGTLNPHTPKKTVASTKILDWIAGKH